MHKDENSWMSWAVINVGFQCLYLIKVLLWQYLHRAFCFNHISLLVCPAAIFPSSAMLYKSFPSKHLYNLFLTNISSGLCYLVVRFCCHSLPICSFNRPVGKVLNKYFFLPQGYTKGFPQSHLVVFLETVSDRSAWKEIKGRQFLGCDTAFHVVTGWLSSSLPAYPDFLIVKTTCVYCTIKMGSCILTHSIILLDITVR